jgi:hypothetical protein
VALGTCYTCEGKPPICDGCFAELLTRWSDSARSFGWRWGAGLRVTLDRRGEAPRSWPTWESDDAVNVRRICSRLVGPLANAVAERRDPRLVEAFAKLCAESAEEAYRTLSIAEARAVIADFDHRLPGWRERLRNVGS